MKASSYVKVNLQWDLDPSSIFFSSANGLGFKLEVGDLIRSPRDRAVSLFEVEEHRCAMRNLISSCQLSCPCAHLGTEFCTQRVCYTEKAVC